MLHELGLEDQYADKTLLQQKITPIREHSGNNQRRNCSGKLSLWALAPQQGFEPSAMFLESLAP